MNVSERPDPAVRRRPPTVTVDGNAAMKSLDIVTINQRERECQLCWNRTVSLRLEIKRDLFLRGALVVSVLCALVCAWVAWGAHADQMGAQAFHEEHKDN